MDSEKLQRFQAILLEQRRRHLEKVAGEGVAAYASSTEDSKDQIDISREDTNKHIEYHLSERERFMVAAIDKALERIEDGEYGICARCEEPIMERRLEVMPTALHCAPCQTAVESNGHYEDDED